MIKRLLKNWLGVTGLERAVWGGQAREVDKILTSDILKARIIEPEDHEPIIVEKPVVKGYVSK
jgi:hypothetical protein